MFMSKVYQNILSNDWMAVYYIQQKSCLLVLELPFKKKKNTISELFGCFQLSHHIITEWQTKYEFKMLQRREEVWKTLWTLWHTKIESKHHIWIWTTFIFQFVEADPRLFSTTRSFSHSKFTRWPSQSISWNQPTRHSKNKHSPSLP